jgi:hypothetical protein
MRRLTTALTAAIFLAALPAVSSAQTRRKAHTATLLTSGDLLVVGGVNQAGATLATAQIIATSRGGAVVNTGSMVVTARSSHTATLLPNGCVLVAGGNTNDAVPAATASSEIYNPATSLWTSAGLMSKARYNHTATLLNDGRVLVCGGQDAAGVTVPGVGGAAKGSCEFYTPTSCTAGAWSTAPDLLQGRYDHTALLLKDGKVWFAGGANPTVVATNGYLATTERFDPTSNSFQSGSPLIEARAYHTATLMGDGKALVVGGYNAHNVFASLGVTESAEIYDPVSNSVTPAAVMEARRQSHSTVLGADGTVTAFGGLGNLTTTFLGTDLDQVFPKRNIFLAGSNATFAGAVVTGGAGTMAINIQLSKPVFGTIENGEIWLDSPTLPTTWGIIKFTAASNTNPAVGLHVDLNGHSVGCKTSTPPVINNCGNINETTTLSQVAGTVTFLPKFGVPVTAPAITGGNLTYSRMIDSSTTQAVLTAAGTISANMTISVDPHFAGYAISGTLTITAGSISSAVYTASLTGGTGNFAGAVVGGTGLATFPITFTNLAGSIAYTATTGTMTSPSGVSATDILTVAVDMPVFTTTGADLADTNLDVSGSTVVIRKMIFADSETYNPKVNSWTIAPPQGTVPSEHRWGATGTLLPENDMIFFGGVACANATCSSEVATSIVTYNLLTPGANFTKAAGAAAGVRAFHTATLLPSGSILAAGGTNGPSVLSSAELFDPVTETFSPILGTMRHVRDLHTATLLPNGRVLIAGGFTTNSASTGSTNTSEIYYPDTKIFLETALMISSRSNHSAIMLPDGRVFVAGGFGTNSSGQNDVPSDTAEIYISTQDRWIPAANMPAGCERAIHATVQLKDGRILLIGGTNSGGVLASTARYDPIANTWNCAAVPAMPSALRSHTATLLFDGRVLVAGGNDGFGENNVSFIYDPVANVWSITSAVPLTEPRFNHTATLLPNGTVMISGGSQRFGNVPHAIEDFHVGASSWIAGPQFSDGPRAFHTMTLALNNKVYGIGGSNGVIGGSGVALYNSAESGYFTAFPDLLSKDSPPSFRQSTIAAAYSTPVTLPPLLPGGNLTVVGNQFRGGTEAAGGGAASANSAFSFPHVILQQVDGSGGSASQSNGGFTVDLTTQVYLNASNFSTLNTSVTVALPLTTAGLPYGWYALRTGANGIYSDGKLLQAGPPKPTVAPSGISGVAQGTSSMSWTWNAIAGVDGYNVYNATTGVFLTTIPVSGAPRYDQTALDPSATSSILIAGYTLTGDGPLTASPTSFTLPNPPISVTIASVTFSDLLLFWGTNSNSFPGTVYEVTESSDNFVANVSTPVPQLFNLTNPFTTISNLSANTTYYFRVRAFNSVGLASAYSLTVSTLTRTAIIGKPTAPPSGLTTTSIVWNWSDPTFANNYRVYNATTGVLLASPIISSFTQTNLGINTAHSIFVTVVTAAGEGPLSPSATAFTAAATPQAATPPVTVTQSTFTVTWNNNGNPLLTPYRISLTEFAPDGSVANVKTTTTSVFTQSFGSLNPSTLFSYTLVAVNGDGIDSATVVGSSWTLPSVPIAVPPPAGIGILGTTPTSITVKWDANNNSSSATYEVTYSTDNFALNIATAIPFSAKFGGTSATIAGLVTAATYYIRVSASNPFGNASIPAAFLSTITFNGGAPAGSIQGPIASNSNSSLFGTLGNGRQVLLRVPAHAFPSDVLVTISSFVPTGTLCPNATNIAFSIVDTPALQPISSLYLTFGFAAPELGTIPASRALLLRYDPGSNTCVPLETTVDSASGQMTARINHFSLFQVGQVPLSTTAETARLFPNPFYAGRDGFLTIDNIPPAARVRIFTLRGEQVLDVKANSAGLLTWSGTNGFGRSVASGVYFVMVESGGTKKILKLAVIR